MRPPGISVALKWTLPPGTLSQGESICRSAVSALREFIFGASGHFWTTNDVMTCETGDAGLGVTASGGWEQMRFRVADYVVPTAQVRVRFSVSDAPNDSITEAGIDAFNVNGGRPMTIAVFRSGGPP